MAAQIEATVVHVGGPALSVRRSGSGRPVLLAELYAAPFDGPEGRAASLRAARALHTEDVADPMPAVEKLTVPVRLVWGTDDEFQPVSYGRRLTGAMRFTLTIDGGALPSGGSSSHSPSHSPHGTGSKGDEHDR